MQTKCYLTGRNGTRVFYGTRIGTPPAYTVQSHAAVRWSRRPWMRPPTQTGRRK